MIEDHNHSEGALAEEDLAFRRTSRLLAFIAVAGVGFAVVVGLYGCASATPDPATVLHETIDLAHCEDIGRGMFRSDAGGDASYAAYYACTVEAGLR